MITFKIRRPDDPATHLSVLGPDRIDILESSVHVALSTRDESSIVVSLRPQQLQSLVRLRSSLLELLGGRVEVGFRGSVSLDGLVDSLSTRRNGNSNFSGMQGKREALQPKTHRVLVSTVSDQKSGSGTGGSTSDGRMSSSVNVGTRLRRVESVAGTSGSERRTGGGGGYSSSESLGGGSGDGHGWGSCVLCEL